MTSTSTATKLPDTSMVNTPVNEATVFEECWSLVQATLDHCLQNEPSETKTWFDANRYISTYTAVYKYCVAPRIKEVGEKEVLFHGELLYKKLDEILTSMLGNLGAFIVAAQNASIVDEYVKYWDRLVVLSRHIEAIFMYVERHWVERQLQQQQQQQGGRSRGATLQVHRIKQLVWLKWESGVLKRVVNKLMSELDHQLNIERASHSLNFCENIKRLISSFCYLCANITSMATQKVEKSRVQVYEEVVEPAYLNSLADHLKKCQGRIVDLDQVRAIWDEEFARASFYLPNQSLEKVKQAIKVYLILPCIELVDASFTTALSEGDSVKCLEIFGLMEVQLDLLNHLDEAFGRYVTDQLVRLPDSSTESFIASILALYRLVTDFVHESLKDRSSMFYSRDAAFRNFLGQHQGGQVLARLAITINHLIKDGAVEAAEFKSQIDNVMAVFRLLDDKEAFLTHYSKLLAHRLLSSSTVDIEKEQFVLDKLNVVCGVALTNSLSKMIADFKAASETTKDYWAATTNNSQNATTKTNSKGSFTVITANNWPLNALPCDFVWPEELRHYVDSFSSHFSSQTKKRRLNWMPHVSRIEIAARCFGDGQECTLVMSILQYVVLRPLLQTEQDNAFLTMDTLSRESQLPANIVSEELSFLTNKKFLVTKTGAGNRLGYAINASFVPCSDYVYLNGMFMDDHVEDVIATSKSTNMMLSQSKSDDEKKLILSAAIVNIAKRQTKVSLSSLVDQVQKKVQPWIPNGPVEGVMSSIEHCIEKEYLKRITPDTLQYIP